MPIRQLWDTRCPIFCFDRPITDLNLPLGTLTIVKSHDFFIKRFRDIDNNFALMPLFYNIYNSSVNGPRVPSDIFDFTRFHNDNLNRINLLSITKENWFIKDKDDIDLLFGKRITQSEYFRLAGLVRSLRVKIDLNCEKKPMSINSVYFSKSKGCAKFRRCLDNSTWIGKPIKKFYAKSIMNMNQETLEMSHLSKANGVLELVHNVNLRGGDATLFYKHLNNCLQWNSQLSHHVANVSPFCSFCTSGQVSEKESYSHLVDCNVITPIRESFFGLDFFSRIPTRQEFFLGGNFDTSNENVVFNLCLMFFVKILYYQRMSIAKLNITRFIKLLNKELSPYTRMSNKLSNCLVFHASKHNKFNEILYIGDHNFVT